MEAGMIIMVLLALVLAYFFDLANSLISLLRIGMFAWIGYQIGHAVYLINYGKVVCGK